MTTPEWPPMDYEGRRVIDFINEDFHFKSTIDLRIFVMKKYSEIWQSSSYLRHYINYM